MAAAAAAAAASSSSGAADMSSDGIADWRSRVDVASLGPVTSEELRLVDKGLVELPLELIESRAKHVKTLNLAENALRSFRHLERFTALDTLVLDKNGLAGLAGFPRLDHVSTLWFNNNAVTDMADFLDEVEAAFPNLKFLSVMRNPASPPMIVMSEEDDKAATRHRLYVIYRLPRLTFLDASPVMAAEREEAKAKGKFLVTRKPKSATAAAAAGGSPTARAAATPGSPGAAPADESAAPAAKREMAAYLNCDESQQLHETALGAEPTIERNTPHTLACKGAPEPLPMLSVRSRPGHSHESRDEEAARAISEIVEERFAIAQRQMRIRIIYNDYFFRDLLGDLVEEGAMSQDKADKLAKLDEFTIQSAITTRELMHLAIRWGLTANAADFWRKHKRREDLYEVVKEGKADRLLRGDPTKRPVSAGATTTAQAPAQQIPEPDELPLLEPASQELVGAMRRESLGRLQEVMTVPPYKGDAFGTRGMYDTGLHYAFRATMRSPPGSPSMAGASGAGAPAPLSLTSSTTDARNVGLVEEEPESPVAAASAPPASSAAPTLLALPSSSAGATASPAKPRLSVMLPEASVPSVGRVRTRSLDQAMADFLSPASRPQSRGRGDDDFPATPFARSSPMGDASDLPQRLPQAPPWDPSTLMSISDFVERNAGFDEFLLGSKAADGARYIEQALGIREVIVKEKRAALRSVSPAAHSSGSSSGGADFSRGPTEDAPRLRTEPIIDHADVPDRAPPEFTVPGIRSLKTLPQTSPVLLRAGVASRIRKVDKSDLYWKPLSRQQRTALVLEPEPPKPPPDPLAELLRNDPPPLRQLKRHLLLTQDSLDTRKIYGRAMERSRRLQSTGSAAASPSAVARPLPSRSITPTSRSRSPSSRRALRTAHAVLRPTALPQAAARSLSSLVSGVEDSIPHDVIGLSRRLSPESRNGVRSAGPHRTPSSRAKDHQVLLAYGKPSPFVTWESIA